MEKIHLKIHCCLFIIASLLLGSCVTKVNPPVSDNSLIWPPNPVSAHVVYQYSFSSPDDLGITKGFLQKLGEFFAGKTNQQIIRPMSVVVTEDEIIYVADPGAGGVHRYNLQKNQYHLISRGNKQILPSPVALTLGPDNSVYVADSKLQKIFSIKKNSTMATEAYPGLTLSQPTGIAYSKLSNQLYISETAKHQIVMVGSDGTITGKIGNRGTGNAQFNYPTYLWLDYKENLYVSDGLNFRIQILDSMGKFKQKFGKAGDGSGNLFRPKGIASDTKDRVFVVDAILNNVQIFNKNGNLLLALGSQGNNQGEFWLPSGIFVTQNNMIYVVDTHNQRIQVLKLMEVTRK